MTPRVFLMLVLVLATAGCASTKKKDDKKKAPAAADIKDQGGDVAFQSFVGLLRKAVAARDAQTLSTMMTPNFGYSLEPPGEGDGVFQFWEENNLWPEVQAVINQKFVTKGNFMVAPPEFVSDPQFSGYRAGITWFGNGWKFAYFIKE
jgi:ABC-type Fe3+-hydroxamate transport system substrate-binding protein